MNALTVPDLEAADFNRAFPPYDANFARVEYGRGMDYYCTRVKAMNFVGHDRVFDAACGVAQWSLALAQFNREVVGADFSQTRLGIGRRVLASNRAVSNVRLVRSDLHADVLEGVDVAEVLGDVADLEQRRVVAVGGGGHRRAPSARLRM